jgi:prepilin-type N-terminal cleavage/methylation domain-containing protein
VNQNNTRRAFTLIELLVVIAIIAILAAILFPVFAQAKLAAKATAALSNTKQQALAILMYQNDYDDNFPLGTEWSATPNGSQLGWSGGPYFSTWAWQVAPYIKTGQIFQDPTTTANPPSMQPEINFDTFYTGFGYNFTFLSPVLGSSGGQYFTSTNSSQAQNASNTVMITSKWVNADNHTGYIWGTGFPHVSGGALAGPQGMLGDPASQPPGCDWTIGWCMTDWGAGGFFDLATDGGIMGVPLPEGRLTGGDAFRSAHNVTVAWVDGHAKSQTYDQLAGGTNFNYNAAKGAPGSQGQFVITHGSAYLWGLSKTCSEFGNGVANGQAWCTP